MNGLTWQVVLIHIFCYPVYQILGTIRHELSHAVAVWYAGLKVTSIRVFPHKDGGRWYWGRVAWQFTPETPRTPVYVYLMPYYVNVVSVVVLALCWRIVRDLPPHGLALCVVLFGMSPLVDTLHNYLKWRIEGIGDMAKARRAP